MYFTKYKFHHFLYFTEYNFTANLSTVGRSCILPAIAFYSRFSQRFTDEIHYSQKHHNCACSNENIVDIDDVGKGDHQQNPVFIVQQPHFRRYGLT